MNSPSDGAIFVGFLTLLGVVLSPIVTGYLNRIHQREAARHAYIDRIVSRLIEVRARLQFFQIAGHDIRLAAEEHLASDEFFKAIWEKAHSEDYKEMQMGFGEAFAIMVSVDIAEIRDKALKVMSPESTEDEKLQGINFALERLGKEYDFFTPK